MDVLQAAYTRRSIRRFTRQPIPRDALESITEAARLAPTGINKQPLQFAVITGDALCAKVFPNTAWARRIPDGSAGPDESTQPTAYIAILLDKDILLRSDTDAGAAAMSMMLVAQSMGIGSCWLGSVNRDEVLSLLDLNPERFALHTLVALGYPAMGARAVPMVNGETDYYLESADMLCVPKRIPEEVIHWYE